MGLYPKTSVVVDSASSVTQFARAADSRVAVRPPLPGSVVLVHGVNDVGVAYGEAERGLCAGLGERLGWAGQYRPASYRMPKEDDKGRLEVDPDAVFFKRQVDSKTYSPVIPFYWGHREEDGQFVPDTRTPHGQVVDRHGNRLDKDASKGGGPFSNATTTLVDMWNRGAGAGPLEVLDRAVKDPLRPILDAPGRMYMVLAAERLAAIVSMVRDYDPAETVSLVCHSQGCMVALLAQALLMQRGLRPADTLVLTHPPYSLVDDLPALSGVATLFGGGTDAAMATHYDAIAGRQTLDARLRTLAAIVEGVAAQKQTTPALHDLKDTRYKGIVGASWTADAPERDNRGKVYLYFCPEDMTVALETVQGIGWQGVPDLAEGSRLVSVETRNTFGITRPTLQPRKEGRRPLEELGRGFFQRVFTARPRRPSKGPGAPQPVLVGAQVPHDFALRTTGEDDHAHVAAGSRTLRASSPEVGWPVERTWAGVVPKPEVLRRQGIRTINGEPLKTPVAADLSAGAARLADGKVDTCHEQVDPIDAAISVTSRYGLQSVWELVDDPAASGPVRVSDLCVSPNPAVYPGDVMNASELNARVEAELNARITGNSQRRQVEAVWRCLRQDGARRVPSGRLLVHRLESADEARLRQQHGQSDRSFHSAIFGSAENHRRVTAYDVAIGQGHAPSRADFNAYLCAVADWRLKREKAKDKGRVGILKWSKFLTNFGEYYCVEPEWRRRLIDQNCTYYSTGELPTCLPVLPGGLPPGVVSETTMGHRMAPGKATPVAPKPVGCPK